MENPGIDFFKIENHFKETEHIPSIPVFENHSKDVPMFTIAIPTYKRADYLKEALNSAINQATNIPYEIIVVDNNPERNDETELLMETYRHIPNLRYYKNSKNIGMTGNWNRLYKLASGDWVIMLHDDDMLFENFIKVIYNKIDTEDDSKLIFPTFTTSKDSIKDNIHKIHISKVRKRHFIKNNFIGPPLGMCIHRLKMYELGGFDNIYFPSVDYAFYVKALFNKMQLIRLNSTPIAFYRWEINATLKPYILKGILCQDIKIRTLILKSYSFLPKIILSSYFQMANKCEKQFIESKITQDEYICPLTFFEKIMNKIYDLIMRR